MNIFVYGQIPLAWPRLAIGREILSGVIRHDLLLPGHLPDGADVRHFDVILDYRGRAAHPTW